MIGTQRGAFYAQSPMVCTQRGAFYAQSPIGVYNEARSMPSLP